MADAARKTGIGIIGDVPWGTHFCHFYRAKEDLINILVPYFKAGLENNEFCLWATAEPLGAREARKAMEKAMPGLDRYLKTGQIEIVPHDQWYLQDGLFDSERVIRAWVDKLDRALAAGYSGMRASGNISWLERKDWESFAAYEGALNRVIDQRQMVVLCAYWMKNISVADTFEVAGSHTFAVVGRNGDLELVEGALYRKKAEEELRSSEERYRLLVENAHEMVVVVQDGKAVFTNPRCAEVFGYTEEEMAARSFIEFIHPDNQGTVMEYYAKRLKGEHVPSTYSLRIIDKGGNAKWTEANTVLLTWKGKPAILGLITDVTERKKAQEELKASEERNRLIADNANEGIMVMQDEKVVFGNPKYIEIAGFPKEEMMSMPFTELVHPDDRQMVAERYLKRLKGEEIPPTYAARVIDKAGNEKWVEAISALFTWNGRPAILALVSDITESKRVEEALRESEERYRLLFDVAPVVISVTTPEGRALSVNNAILEMSGYTPEEFVALNMNDIYVDPLERRRMRALLQREGRVRDFETGFRRKDGSISIVLLNTDTIELDNQRLILATVRDITERKRVEEALEQHNRLLATTNALAIELASLPSREIGEAFVTKRLAEMTGATAVWFSEYDPSDRALVLRHIEMETELGEKVARLLGKQPNEVRSPVSEDMYSEIVSNVIGKRQTLTEVSFGAIPPSVGTAIQELMGVDHFIGIAYVIEGELYGTLMLAMRAGRPDPARELLESVAHMVAISLRQRRAEDTLRQSEKKYRFMAENVSDVIWIIDMNLRPAYLSPSITKMTGYSVEETMARGMEKGLNPAAIEAISEIVMAEVARKGEPNSATWLATVEVEMEHKDGSKIWAESAGTLLRGSDGQPFEIIGILRDITKRRQVLAALESSEDRFRSLVESGVDGILLVDSNGTISYGAPSMTAMLGYEEGSNDGRSITDFVHPDDLPEAGRLFGQLVSNPGGTEHMELRTKHKSGSWKWAEVVGSNLLHDHAVEAIVLNLRDIHDRKKAQNALAESEKKYRQLVETIREGIWVIDKDARTTFVNPRMAKMLGYTIEEMTGKYLFAFMDERGVEIAKYNLERRQQGIEEQHDFEFLRKDGTRVYTSLETSAIIDDKGDYAGAIAGVQDITARKQAEEELQRQQKHFRALIENASDAITIAGADGTISYESPSCERMSGFKPEERIGANIVERVHPDDIKRLSDAFSHLIRHPGGTMRDEMQLRHKDGTWLTVETTVTNLIHDPAVQGIVINLRDITARKQAEEALKKGHQLLNDTGEMAKVGGWGLDLSTNEVSWTEEVGRIHGVGPGYRPKLEEALDFYAPESRSDVEAVVRKAAETGKPYDLEALFIPRGSKDKIWVRALGKAIYSGDEIVGLAGTFQNIDKYKRAEEALRESEQKYRMLFETMAQGVTYQDSDGQIVSVNPAAERILGLTFDQMQGRTSTDPRWRAVHEDGSDFPGETHPSMVSLRSGEPVSNVVMGVFNPIEEGYRWININAIPQFKPGEDRPYEVYATFADITKRKRAEESLIASETRYRLLAENLSDIIWTMGTDLKYTYISPSVTPLRGYTVEEAMAQPLAENLTPASLETAMKIMVEEEAMERTGQYDPNRAITMEVEVSCKNGSTIWMENKVTYLRDSNGRIATYLGVSRDITERKRAEEQLQRQEMYFRAITERSSDVVVVLGKEGTARYVSPTVERMLGITREQAEGAGFMNSVHPDDIPKVAEDWAYLIEHPGVTRREERRIQHADGSWRYVEATGYSLLDDPAVEGVVINIRDITVFKQAEIRQRQTQGQLILASRLASLGRLASGVAHEINNPLAVVMGCAQMLMEKDAPEDIKKDLRLINDGAEQMASVVQRLLTFGRQSKPGKQYVDINTLVSRVIELRAREMSAHNIEVTTRLDPDLSYTMADPGQMQQVFLNIILNAEQSMMKANNHGHLLVETGHTRDRIKITFKDDGIGVPKEYLPRLFDPFFTTKDVGEGMGLGLSISYGIIQEHDGRIYVKKQSGKGATFVVELPIMAKPDQPESPEKPAEEPREKVIGRILVVDDEPAICQLLKDLLTRDGHSVETVGDAAVALEMLKRERFSLILLDIRMKGMNGIELYQQMGKIAESLQKRVIFITGDTLARETRDFLDGAAAPHICKPFDIQQLRKMVNRVLWSEG